MLLARCATGARRPFRHKALLLVAGLVLVCLWLRDAGRTAALVERLGGGIDSRLADPSAPAPASRDYGHPIDDLIHNATRSFHALRLKESTELSDAEGRYLERRGRRPPPGFGTWFRAARAAEALVIEDLFDRIYHDVAPLWALEPRRLRQHAHAHDSVIRVRRGKAAFVGEVTGDTRHRIEQWTRLVAELAPQLPDLDMPINTMDESRVLVPWERMTGYVAAEQRQRRIIDAAAATSRHAGPADDGGGRPDDGSPRWIRDQATRYWDHVAAACPPESPARQVGALPEASALLGYPEQPADTFAHRGFVRNFTAAQDVCSQPHLRGLHGTFTESISMATTHELVPLFGESKLTRNNELLIPAAVYLDDSRLMYSGGKGHGGGWWFKKKMLVWRGVSSGGRNRRHNWWRMHRNRFVQMLNGSAVAAVDEAQGEGLAAAFRLPSPHLYPLRTLAGRRLGQWVSAWADAGFTQALCEPPADVETVAEPRPRRLWPWPREHKSTRFCRWLRPWFAVASPLSMEKQYGSKYLPDIDGNSFSGRYRAFLLSTSLPLKATIYTEWHDDRLFPWLHFVPMDNSFVDLYGLVDYLLDHDDQAYAMAAEGKRWAEQVLRREDMKLYVWRLLLEYARVVDDNRDTLAFVANETAA